MPDAGGTFSGSAQRYIYCLNCFYNLYGLAEDRCPECGRRFDRADSRTFSDSPNPEHLPKLIQRAALAIHETVRQLTPRDAAATREVLLLRRMARLESENASLRFQLQALVAELVDTSALSAEQASSVLGAQGPSLADALENISPEGSDEPDTSKELLDMHAAQLGET